jgi:hypothetical protein
VKPSNEEAWDFAVRALWENYRELRVGAKGAGLALTPAEADRLAHNIKWPPHRPPGILDDLQARLLAGGEGSSNLMLSPADCEMLACNMTTPKRPKGRKPNDDMHIALRCIELALMTPNLEAAVQQTTIDRACSRGDVFRALRKFRTE